MHYYRSCKSHEAFSQIFPIAITVKVVLMITRWRFWSGERRCSACSTGVMASHSWTQRKSYCCLHICVWVSAQRPEVALYRISLEKKSNNHLKLTGRQMCENNRAIFPLLRPWLSVIDVIGPTAARQLSKHFVKAVEQTNRLQLKHSAIAQKAGSGETGRSLGYLLGRVLRGNSARDADSPENGSMAPWW